MLHGALARAHSTRQPARRAGASRRPSPYDRRCRGAEVPNDRTLDGVDLMPFINGIADGVPHETLFWRRAGTRRSCTGLEAHPQADLLSTSAGCSTLPQIQPSRPTWRRRPAKVAELEAPLAAITPSRRNRCGPR